MRRALVATVIVGSFALGGCRGTADPEDMFVTIQVTEAAGTDRDTAIFGLRLHNWDGVSLLHWEASRLTADGEAERLEDGRNAAHTDSATLKITYEPDSAIGQRVRAWSTMTDTITAFHFVR